MTYSKPSAWPRIVAFIAVFSIIASLTAVHTGRLFGHKLTHDTSAPAVTTQGETEVINTTTLAENITGYGGPVPVEIYLTDGRIDSVRALPNTESPQFFAKLSAAGLPQRWNGKTLDEASAMQVDAVSGATFSSKAVIANVSAGIEYARHNTSSVSADSGISVKQIAALIIILCAAILPLFFKKPAYRLAQQLANVAVLGFWSGTFIDYAMMLTFFSNAPVISLAWITTLVLLVVGFIYPAFGKPSFYCTWVCPLGSLQELAGRVSKKKIKLSATTVKRLDSFRQILWIGLLTLLYIGWGTAWIDNELFTAFIVQSASWIVLVVGIIFICLSVFITRPFRRFVCPTGSILKQA